jgi:hypothetical protein
MPSPKGNKRPKGFLKAIAFILIWLVPLTYIGIIAIDITTATPSNDTSGTQVVISVWAIIVLAILMIVYIVQLRKRLIQVLHISDIQDRPVPPFWRLIQLVEYAVSFAMLIGIVFVINALSGVLYTFGFVSLISGSIGYTLLMIDSVVREKHYQETKLLERIK